MTTQASDIFRYKDFEYYLLDYDGEGLIYPHDFGMQPEYVDTGCYAGFISTYEITQDGLFLTQMVIANTLDKYSTIQGIKPEFIKENSSYLIYQRLRLFTPYTGTLQLGRHYTKQEKESCELFGKEIKEYKKITKLAFDEGIPTYGQTIRDDGFISNYDFFDSVDREFEYLKNRVKVNGSRS